MKRHSAWVSELAIAVCCVFFPSIVRGQSTLTFPRQVTKGELSSTGYAFVNTSNTPASLTFTFYSETGAILGTSVEPLPASGQLAKLGAELFPTPSGAGWVQVTSATSGVIGFWLGGDFTTFTDGGEAAQFSGDIVFPLVTNGTELSVANVNPNSTTVTLRLLGPSGVDVVPAVTQPISGRGILQMNVSGLFKGANLSGTLSVRATAAGTGAAISGSSVTRGFLVGTESAVVNAVDALSPLSTLNFPHAISGAIGSSVYVTSLGVTNLSSSPQTVTLTFTPEPSGQPVVVTRTLQGYGSLRDQLRDIFNLPSGFQNGWVKVFGNAPIAGTLIYADTSAGALTAVPVQAVPKSTMLFAHIAGLPVWYSGIALLNTSTNPANIEVSGMTPSGTLIGSKTFTLAAGHKDAKLLSELIPQAESQNGGFVVVRSNVPVYGMELFGSTNGAILADVAGGAVPVVYDGTWTGQFSVAATPLGFVIANNRLTNIVLNLVITAGNTSCITTLTLSGSVPIINDAFNFSFSVSGLTSRISGLFTAPNQMIGTIGQVNYANYSCPPLTFTGSTPGVSFSTSK